MFEILPNPSLETLLIAGRAVLLVGAFWIFALAFTRWRRADERDSQALRDQLERAFTEMRSLHETVTVMNARIEAMSERSETDSRRPQLPAAVVASAQARGYDLALRMAKNGSAAEDLVANCGITRHEAELLTRLHAAKSQPEVAAWQARQQQQVAQAQQQQAPAPQPTGRKRGSLLSVVS
jgi:hypothetical protein